MVEHGMDGYLTDIIVRPDMAKLDRLKSAAVVFKRMGFDTKKYFEMEAELREDWQTVVGRAESERKRMGYDT
jgi:hypothetical protein